MLRLILKETDDTTPYLTSSLSYSEDSKTDSIDNNQEKTATKTLTVGIKIPPPWRDLLR
jgi:hypothetical protein